MGFHHKINEGMVHFVTMTVVGWIDVFTRENHKMAIVDSLKYCQQTKGLEIYGWCLMSSHLHMIISAKNDFNLSDVLRDFKKFTSKEIIRLVKKNLKAGENRCLINLNMRGAIILKLKTTSSGKMEISPLYYTARNLLIRN